MRLVVYPMIYRLSYKLGDCLEFLPSTKQYSEISISTKDLLKSFRARNAQLEKFPVKTWIPLPPGVLFRAADPSSSENQDATGVVDKPGRFQC